MQLSNQPITWHDLPGTTHLHYK